MSQHVDITEVSDPRDMNIDAPPASAPHLKVVKGQPTDIEVAALIAVLAAAGGHSMEPAPQELNTWGHPVDKLRYSVTSWQRVTLIERTHMRR